MSKEFLGNHFLLEGKIKYLLFAVLVVFVLIGFAHMSGLLLPGGDASNYVILAQSLLQGKGYNNIYLISSFSHIQSPPIGEYWGKN